MGEYLHDRVSRGLIRRCAFFFLILPLHQIRMNKCRHYTEAERARRADTACEPADPANTVTDRLNNLLKNGGDGYILQLCPNQRYLIQAPILFAHNNQEISTAGHPTDDSRAVLSVSGPVNNGEGHTTAVDGTCGTCSGVKLRYVQVISLYFEPVTISRPFPRLMVHAVVERQPKVAGTLKWAEAIRTNLWSMSVHTILGAGVACTPRKAH